MRFHELMEDTTSSDGTGGAGSESTRTVVIAFLANAAVAVAKSVAAFVTGSASMVAEAAHSWADTGNEVFLLVADRRGRRPRDADHPLGFGREAYVWSLFAGFGLFTIGAAVSIANGVNTLRHPGETDAYLLNYVVLAVAFVLEGVSFVQALGQSRRQARARGLTVRRFIYRTSDPTLRAVFLEDLTALIGLGIAAVGVFLHEVTGDAVWDALGSIAVGVLLGAVAVFLIQRNREFIVGESVAPEWRERALSMLLDERDIERVTYLHLEWVGPGRVFLIAAVDLVGNDDERHLAVRLRDVEDVLERSPLVEDAVLTLSRPDAPSLEAEPPR